MSLLCVCTNPRDPRAADCQLHVVHLYLMPCNIFFEAHDMIQMEAKRRERWAWYRTRQLAEQSLKSKVKHLKGADPVRYKSPQRLSINKRAQALDDRISDFTYLQSELRLKLTGF